MINYGHGRQNSKQAFFNFYKDGEMREIRFNSEVMKFSKLFVVPTKENFTTARLELGRYQKVFSHIILILSETGSFVILKSQVQLEVIFLSSVEVVGSLLVYLEKGAQQYFTIVNLLLK